MDPATRRTGSHVGLEDKTGAAALANGSQSATGERFVPDCPGVGIIDKFHQFPSFGKRTCSISTSSTITHNQSPVPFLDSPI